MSTWWEEVNLQPMDGAVGAIKYPLIHMVEDEFEKHRPPIVTRKGEINKEPDSVWKKHETYMENFSWYRWSNFTSHGRATAGSKLRIQCEKFMREHGERQLVLFLAFTHKTIEQAILETESLTDLWNEFFEWFERRKEKFMEKMKAEIVKKTKKNPVSLKPTSHGGVANLLKVLTRTMQEQGADIRSIALVQYKVCRDAGILLPDEFLTDVATVLDAEESAREDFG